MSAGRAVLVPFSGSTLGRVTGLLARLAEGRDVAVTRAGSVEELIEMKDALECAFYLQAKEATNLYIKAMASSIYFLLGYSPSDELRDSIAQVVMGLSHTMRMSVLRTIPLVSLLIISTSQLLQTIPWRDVLLSLFSLTERDIRSIDEDCNVESKDGIVRVPLCSPPQLIEKGQDDVAEEAGSPEDSREVSVDRRVLRVKLPRLPPSSPLSAAQGEASSRDFSHLLTPRASPPSPETPPRPSAQAPGPRASNAPFYLSILRYLMIEHLLSNVSASGRDEDRGDGAGEEMVQDSYGEVGNSRANGTHLSEIVGLPPHNSVTGTPHYYPKERVRLKQLEKQRRTNIEYKEEEHEDIMNNKNIPLDVLYLILTYIPYPYRSIRVRNAPHKEAMLLLQWMRYGGRFNFGCVRALDISKCGIDASDAVVLSNIIRDSPSLIKLCIGNNRLGADGLEVLSRAFSSTSCNISAIHLEHNAIGPKGASIIAKILVGCKGLMSISLGYNQLGPEIEPICNALCDCRCSLMTLDIANNYVGDNGASCLAKALKSPLCTKTLKCVRVWDPSMTSLGGDMLVEALENNKMITEMGIGDSALTKEAKIRLNRALRDNRGIVESNDPLVQRRRHEVDLLYGADSVFSDTWFLIDERWLAEWRDFARENSDAPPPGKISNWRLVRSDGTPIPGREKLRDYRGVCPKVYALFHSIYGGGPAIVRSKIDLYSEPAYYDLDTLLGDSGNL